MARHLSLRDSFAGKCQGTHMESGYGINKCGLAIYMNLIIHCLTVLAELGPRLQFTQYYV